MPAAANSGPPPQRGRDQRNATNSLVVAKSTAVSPTADPPALASYRPLVGHRLSSASTKKRHTN